MSTFKARIKRKSTMKKGLEICYISSFPPSRARLSEYAYPLISELQRLPQIGHIDIIANTIKNNTIEKINDKITVYRTWKGENIPSLLSILHKLSTLKPDIVHFNLHMAIFGSNRITNFIGLCLPFLCRIMGFKTIVTLHNIVEMIDIERTGFRNTTLNRAGALIATKMLTFASAVTLTVRSYLKILKRRYGCKKVFWVPHGTWKVDPVSHQRHNPKILLYFGYSGPYKDLDLLFNAFEMLRKKRLDVKLIIAGASHPNYPDFLRKYVSEKPDAVDFIGYIPNHKLLSLFKKIDLVVLPYYTCTGTSGVAHLVSSYGIPIIATDLPEFRELVKEGCGILLSPHNPNELAENIELVINNIDSISELKERSRNFAQRRTWNKIALSFFKVYEQVFDSWK
ncbi:MAG: glycosyltransferase [Candidatus Hodarchaeota archaeon]